MTILLQITTVGRALGAGDRHALAVGPAHGQVGEEGEHVVAAESTPIEPEQVEQEPGHQALRHQRAWAAVLYAWPAALIGPSR